ncbi:unnamed protein product [Arctogadus glacialis]
MGHYPRAVMQTAGQLHNQERSLTWESSVLLGEVGSVIYGDVEMTRQTTERGVESLCSWSGRFGSVDGTHDGSPLSFPCGRSGRPVSAGPRPHQVSPLSVLPLSAVERGALWVPPRLRIINLATSAPLMKRHVQRGVPALPRQGQSEGFISAPPADARLGIGLSAENANVLKAF